MFGAYGSQGYAMIVYGWRRVSPGEPWVETFSGPIETSAPLLEDIPEGEYLSGFADVPQLGAQRGQSFAPPVLPPGDLPAERRARGKVSRASPELPGLGGVGFAGATTMSAGGVMISLASLITQFGIQLGKSMFLVLKNLAPAGGRVPGGMWQRMPGWVRQALTTMGLAEGADFIFDISGDADAPGDLPPSGGAMTRRPPGFGQFPGVNGLPVLAGQDPLEAIQSLGALIARRWTANGVPMVRLWNGLLGAYSKKHQKWSFRRPAKPIVLMPSGASNLRTLLKASRAVNRQLQSLKKEINKAESRGPRRARRPATTIVETGPGSVNVK